MEDHRGHPANPGPASATRFSARGRTRRNARQTAWGALATPALADGTYGDHFGDTLAPQQNGAVNDNGAPLVDPDLRCVVANATGVAGYWGNAATSCSESGVDQLSTGGILGG
ncbi:hypothetical protein [Streptacidiphilus fuscans]|uniref:Uncharacterized protein n=1 Tax=Streptacidiphilus fuscans TaxID=2789292 RepID=A0A931FG82_9ACTN|nr:hypothetical protein [Streptacidiphilus fuscans]MBF9072363.1 hypothetical protein [Streptacidiphilus fuscans]